MTGSVTQITRTGIADSERRLLEAAFRSRRHMVHRHFDRGLHDSRSL
jgi:hypothetical protein